MTEDETKQLQQWQAANPWFNQNQALAQAAIGIEAHMAAHGIPLQDRLAHTTRILKRGLDPADEPARRAYEEITRVDPRFGQRISEDQYVAIANSRR